MFALRACSFGRFRYGSGSSRGFLRFLVSGHLRHWKLVACSDAVLRDTRRKCLTFAHLGEFAAEVIKGVISPLFDDAAFFEDEDGVAVSDGGQAMGYEDYGLFATQGVYAVLDFGFGFAIQGAGGLVQDEEAGVFVEFAGNGDSLSLAA